MSKGALWATSTLPRANSKKAGSTASMAGAVATIASVMPVSTLTNGRDGPARIDQRLELAQRSHRRGPCTAPNSVMASVPAAPPVVSRSTTVKVVGPQRLVELVEARLHDTGRGDHAGEDSWQ